MANKDLFKQAIAEAKSIREAAITNAKEALEETLTPHLKDMLAAKLQEMEDTTVEEEVVNESEEVTEAQGNMDANDENPHDQLEEAEKEMEEAHCNTKEEGVEEAEEKIDEAPGDEADADAEVDSEESEDEAEDEEEIEVKDMEVDDLKDLIRDIIAQEMGRGEEELDNADMDAGEEMGDMEAGAEEEEINLDELLAELEEEIAEGGEMEEAHCNTKEEGVEEEISEAPGDAHKKKMKEGEHDGKKKMEEGEHDGKKKMEESSELKEALETIETLQGQLQEVNLLNAKLMYVNKVFKSNNLNESQKVNIIAAFDKAETVKEVKLVFETVSESIVVKKSTPIKESKLGMASKATGTTASKPEVIAEVSSAVQRMQKLAGII